MKLFEIAKVIRSKNAGPFELTLDIMFNDRATYDRVRKAEILSAEKIALLYGIPETDVLGVIEFEPAYAIKITIVRPVGSGSLGDTDIYGAQQHAPLFDLEVP